MIITLKYFSKIVLLSLTLVFIINCATNTHAPIKRHKNLSYLYNDSEVFLHPKFQIYNFSEDSSKVYFNIPIQDLLIKDLGNSYDKYALIEIHYRVYESLSVSSLIDSSTFTQRVFVRDKNKNYTFNIKTPKLTRSYLRLQVKDIFSERKRADYIYIDKGESVNRQSFLITNKSNTEIVFGTNLLLNNTYSIESPLIEKHNLLIQEQKLVKSVANIPSSLSRTNIQNPIIDSSYLYNNDIFKPEKVGIYFLSLDTSKIKGLALFVNDSVNNLLRTPSQMLMPTSYLLSNKEYTTLLNDSNPKFALDKLWLKLGDNPRHASEMIKVYYNRVATSNKYFSSYKEGWMTDRGMIYIIYGEPSTIYKSETLERWIYGSVDSEKSLSFDFELIKNLLSKNNFELIRNEEYKKSWFQAIDAWRNGRIYSIAK